MGAVKRRQMGQEEMEQGESDAREDPDKFEQECEDRWIDQQIEDEWIERDMKRQDDEIKRKAK